MKRTLAIMVMMLLAVSFSFTQIRNTKHDLSSTSTTGIKSNVDDLCVFCHTPHSKQASTVLWNRTASSVTTYALYSSPSMEFAVNQPGSSSKNCLSCHDGTVGLNSLINSPGSGAGTLPGATTPAKIDTGATSYGGLGTILSNDHPIGFIYNTHQAAEGATLRVATLVGTKVGVANGGTPLPLVGTTVANATMECTSCHDPHKSGAGFELFKRVSNAASAMCFTCHNK